ncbi:MAG: FtsW/RodA/SpoVE family cell cycle protein, partial [Candidatus Colwellbacteria bacterium]|nr:FtsW/RodA/SpoVE family cell cycle protein [Candidatus Colwellbacteria bacterium]
MFEGIKKKSDVIIIFIICALLVLGLAALASASSSISIKNAGNPYFYLKRQFLILITAGLAGFFAGMFTPLKWLKKASLPLLILNLGLLALVFTPLGGNFGTASRWIEVGGIPIQPSEFLKITFIIYLAAWITTKGKNRGGFAEGLLPFILMCGVIGALLIAQPSTSILVVLLIVAGLMYFMGGLKFSFVAAIIGIAAIALGVIIISTPYRLERF